LLTLDIVETLYVAAGVTKSANHRRAGRERGHWMIATKRLLPAAKRRIMAAPGARDPFHKAS